MDTITRPDAETFSQFLDEAEKALRLAAGDNFDLRFNRWAMKSSDDEAMSMVTTTCEECPRNPGLQAAIFADATGKVVYEFDTTYRCADDVSRAMWADFEREIPDALSELVEAAAEGLVSHEDDCQAESARDVEPYSRIAV